MKKPPKIYLAGPMRGIPYFNRYAFNDYTIMHRNVGWEVVNPVEIGDTFGKPEEIDKDPALLAAVMAAELHALETCDAIFLLKGWEKSVGAKKELATALAYGLEIHLQPNIVIPLVRREP